VVFRHKQSNWRAAILCGVLAVGAVPGTAHAGLFDFLFGGPDRGPAPPVNSYAEPSAPLAPAPLGQESVRNGGSGTGHGVAYCVRLCDGQHFPLERMSNATPVETCRAMCPASKTKVFFGSEIGGAVARDGAHYADLDTAFIYRKQLVANCTCNGKDAFGLAPFDLSSDPTLRPGDIVSTKDGYMTYNGGRSGNGTFTPADPAVIASALNPASARVRVSRKTEPKYEARNEATGADDDPGTVALPQSAPPPVNLGANYRAQAR
jgi:hypothetical protein